MSRNVNKTWTLDTAVADLIIAENLPLTLVASERFRMVLRAAGAPNNYVPPSRDRMSGELLENLSKGYERMGMEAIR